MYQYLNIQKKEEKQMAYHNCKSINAASQFLDKFETLLSPASNTSPDLKESVFSSTTSKGTSHFPAAPTFPVNPEPRPLNPPQDDPFTCRATNSATRYNIFQNDKAKIWSKPTMHEYDKENAAGVENDSNVLSLSGKISSAFPSGNNSIKKCDEGRTLKPSLRYPLGNAKNTLNERIMEAEYEKTRAEELVSTDGKKYNCAELPMKGSNESFSDTFNTLEIDTVKKSKLHLLSDTNPTLGGSLRNTDHHWVNSYKRLENEKLKLEKQVLEYKIALKTQAKEKQTELADYKRKMSEHQQKYEAEINCLQNRMKQQNERFYERLSEKEKEFESRLKMEVEHKIGQEKAELIKALSQKDQDISSFQSEIKKLQEQIEAEKQNTERIRIQLKAEYGAKVQMQAKAQISFESETLSRLEREKAEEMRRMQERFDLDLEYERYKLRRKGYSSDETLKSKTLSTNLQP
eukprot:TRINITY_DN1602_c0_g1_i1.p2 TRINITY_DN1602_c0_g1~~TRINITY_DN1602_c0_g1_i1.p2  ORF type:complete len:461 (-),score=63.69 TRINITY_DN1602_c0_g1_i1:6200-7582(-)